MPTKSFSLGDMFATALGAKPFDLKREAEAHVLRQQLDTARRQQMLREKQFEFDRMDADRNFDLKRVDADKAAADAEKARREAAILQNQTDAAGKLGPTLADHFTQSYIRHNTRPPETRTVMSGGRPDASPVRREVVYPDAEVPDDLAALFAQLGPTFASTVPGANPDQFAQGYNRLIGGHDFRYGRDNDVVRRGAVMATEKLPDSDTVLTEEDREAVYEQKRQEIMLKEMAKAEADGTSSSGPFAGSSEFAINSRIIYNAQLKVQAGEPLTPDEVVAVQIAKSRLYAPKTNVSPKDDGSLSVVRVEPEAPGFVDQLGAEAPDAGAAVQSSPEGPTAPAETPALAPDAGAAGGTTTSPVPGVTVTKTDRTVPKPLTEAEAKNELFESTMSIANDALTQYEKSPMAFMQMPLLRGDMGGDTPGMTTLMLQEMTNAMSSPEQQTFMTHAENFINPALRKDSGAAVPVSEYPKYFARFIPVYGDSPERVQLKSRYRTAYLSALQEQISQIQAAKGTDEYKAAVKAVFETADAQLVEAAPAPAAGPGETGGEGEIPAPATIEDAMKLPSGTKFRTPDGRIKVRP